MITSKDLIKLLVDTTIFAIADEVMTDFGRTGEWFASNYWNFRPDY